jgi:hypothetical protein
MRLADARRADQAQAARTRGELLGEATRVLHGGYELFVRVDDEGVEIAPAVPRRHTRLFEEARRQRVVPAVAPDNPADTRTSRPGFHPVSSQRDGHHHSL